MVFNSFEFLLFFPLILFAFYSTKPQFRWILLLAASYYFYMSWNPAYIILIIISTLIDYVLAIKIENAGSQKHKKMLLISSVVLNLGTLFFFKYFNFFNDQVAAVFGVFDMTYEAPVLNILLPIGISFYTFQTMSYTIDVYRGYSKAERNLGYFALYVAYFPQLVAGPIERAKRLLPQIKRDNKIDITDVQFGLNKIAYGFFKKVVVADNVSMYVNSVYANLEGHTGPTIFFANLLFFIVLYCDFSGYSDIAIGTARLMGVRLMENFNRPMLSSSVTEFWQKWHISLSSWLRDYVYMEVKGDKKSELQRAFALLITFTLVGFWHGASWTFVLFGVAHGLFMVLENFGRAFRIRNPLLDAFPAAKHWSNVAVTMLVIILISGPFFRAQSLDDSWLMFGKIFTLEGGFNMNDMLGGILVSDFLLCMFVIFLFFLSYLLPRNLNLKYNTLFLVLTTVIIILFGTNEALQFVYFQF